MKYRLLSVVSTLALAVILLVGSVPAALASDSDGAKLSKRANNGVYIVRMAELPVVSYDGSIAGYKATQPGKGQKIDPLNSDVVRYVALLDSRHDQALNQAGGGRKATLQLAEDRLLFILVYMKTYPLQEIMAELFDLDVSNVNEWIHRLLPLLRDALDELGVLPERDAHAVAQAQTQRPAGQTVIVDGTERRRQRPKNPEKQALHYSGKKKAHTDKNLVIAERKTRRVTYLSQTYPGVAHDKKIADHEQIQYAPQTILYQDTGFQGYQPVDVRVRQPKKSRAAVT